MRVIAGRFRSRPLLAPRGQHVRPSSDRLRETLFNVLAPVIVDAWFIDLYAGSGAVGIEAASRGAAQVLWVEQDRSVASVLLKNLHTLALDPAGVWVMPASRALPKLAQRVMTGGRPAGATLIFLDPPYREDGAYEQVLQGLSAPACAPLLTADVRVIAEHRRRLQLGERYGPLRKQRVLEQGDSALSFFSLETASEPGELEG